MFYVGVGPCQEGQKSQKFKAIVDMLAISNTHFKKLKDFIHMQLPSHTVAYTAKCDFA